MNIINTFKKLNIMQIETQNKCKDLCFNILLKILFAGVILSIIVLKLFNHYVIYHVLNLIFNAGYRWVYILLILDITIDLVFNRHLRDLFRYVFKNKIE